MPIFMIFYPHLLPQLSEKKREGRKIYEKNVKTACKTTEGGKTNNFDSWGGWIPSFVIEG